MFNIGAGELIVILIIALIVLGPDKLPDAVRRAGRLYGELRRMSSGFQAELRDVLDEPMREVRSTTDLVKGTFTSGIDARDDDPATPRVAKATAKPSAKPTRLLTDADALVAVESDPIVADDGALDEADRLDDVAGDRPVPLPPPGQGQAAAPLPPPGTMS